MFEHSSRSPVGNTSLYFPTLNQHPLFFFFFFLQFHLFDLFDFNLKFLIVSHSFCLFSVYFLFELCSFSFPFICFFLFPNRRRYSIGLYFLKLSYTFSFSFFCSQIIQCFQFYSSKTFPPIFFSFQFFLSKSFFSFLTFPPTNISDFIDTYLFEELFPFKG